MFTGIIFAFFGRDFKLRMRTPYIFANG
ncbi:hypothetical protein CY0110_18987 [Crocosphaera chwakensis CCY0110]|uniref:Uncharacterized protein n=1 Tax=Crocosphaera chwakensis CCY0110 TaxID=391612 RepID=A3IJC9_9CHRO|nr:hypothetical protein CY0110_18987 [Crocosphaera chwakensis CCY0110]